LCWFSFAGILEIHRWYRKKRENKLVPDLPISFSPSNGGAWVQILSISDAAVHAILESSSVISEFPTTFTNYFQPLKDHFVNFECLMCVFELLLDFKV
jgi:hypothetical protein